MEDATENKPDEPETVWHYTKMENLEKIFPPKGKEGNGKIRIRFTNVRYTNDPSESLIIREYFKNNREKILQNLKTDSLKEIYEDFVKNEITNNIYVFSTTSLEDSFAFWSKEYAGLDGIAIGIRKNKMGVQLEENRISSFGKVHYLPYSRVEFKHDNLAKDFSDFISFAYSTDKNYRTSASLLDCYSSFFKHKSWKYEEETRFIIVNDMYQTSTPQTKFIGNKTMRIIYENFNNDIISSLMVGPCCGYEHKEAIENYLEENGYNTNEIKTYKSSALDLRYSPSELTNEQLRKYLMKLLEASNP